MTKGIVKTKYCIAFLLAALLLISFLFGINARAYEAEDFSITGVYVVGGVEFRLYQIGLIDDSGKYEPTDEYAEYHIDYHENEAAQTLEAYIARDKKEPFLSGNTDTKSRVEFDGLSKGVYLLTGSSSEQNGERYSPMPMIVVFYGDEDENFPVVIKYEKEQIQNTKDISVLKIWEDNNSKERPDKISVQLLKNGNIYESVILNEENNWRYQWKALDGSAEWTLTEKSVPDNYTVKISGDSDDFVVTNTAYTEDEPSVSSEDENSQPINPESTPKSSFETPNSSPNVSSPSSNPNQSVMGAVLEKLPQTGQLNMPILILLPAGLVLIIIGVVRRKKSG